MKKNYRWMIPVLAVSFAAVQYTGAGAGLVYGAAAQEEAEALFTIAAATAQQEEAEDAEEITDGKSGREKGQKKSTADELTKAEETDWNLADAVVIEIQNSSVLVDGSALQAVEQNTGDQDTDTQDGTDADTDQEKTDESAGITWDGSILSINEAGTYRLSGQLKGSVVVSASKKKEVVLILDGLTVDNPEGEALLVKKTGQLILALAEGTENVLTSGAAVEITEQSADDSAEASGAAVRLKADTVITGSGSLVVNGYLNHGIQTTKSLTIQSGDLTVQAVHHGIKSKSDVIIDGGNISILSGSDGIHAEQEEIQATEEVLDEEGQVIAEAQEAQEGAGTVTIHGGSLSIDSYGDAIQAYLDVTVTGGTLDLKTEGEYDTSSRGDSFGGPGGFGGGPGNSAGGQGWDFDQTDGTVSEKGLKSDGTLTITGGEITMDTVDDGLHCAGLLTIEDGIITISTGDDGIHSDKQIDIYGGNITILDSYEGIEANQINVYDGEINLYASDDGFNANGGSDGFGSFGGPGGRNGDSRGANANTESVDDTDASDSTELPNLNIYGGTIYVNASGDGLDSNGNITVSGGVTVVDGPTDSANGALDAGAENGGTISISDGTVFAWGASGMAETFGSGSGQASFLCTLPVSYAAGTIVTVTDEEGTELFRHMVASGGNSLVFSSPDLEQGSTYRLIAGEDVYEITLSGVSTTVRASSDGTTEEGASQGASQGGRGGFDQQGGQRQQEAPEMNGNSDGPRGQGQEAAPEMNGNSNEPRGQGQEAAPEMNDNSDGPKAPEQNDTQV